ncbi:MAG: hypothetical protein GY883_02695 [Shimia sp.]|nr:hypothetical protein [Shimia sp.]
MSEAQEEAVREYIATLTSEAEISKTDAAGISPDIIQRSDLLTDGNTQD